VPLPAAPPAHARAHSSILALEPQKANEISVPARSPGRSRSDTLAVEACDDFRELRLLRKLLLETLSHGGFG
jgi:hypothetical protein